MNFRILPIAWSMAFALIACSKQDSTHVKTVAPEQILETVVKGKGFTAGSIDSTTVAYAIFDPSCGPRRPMACVQGVKQHTVCVDSCRHHAA